MSELKIGIILGSTRPGRNGKAVADWVLDKGAGPRIGADYDLIDLADHPLPHMDEPMSPMLGQYAGEHTKAWAATIAPYDGYVLRHAPSTTTPLSGVPQERDRLPLRRVDQQGRGLRPVTDLWAEPARSSTSD